jgi:glycosyltransferase involved in cell wall biosynthesis
VVARDAMRVIPNGVDTEAFAFRDGSARDGMRLVYSGKMSYHANAATARFLVEEIMPIVWRKQPQATLWVVGKDPGKEMQEWTRRYPERVVVTGEVPDMGAVISTAAVSLAPLVYGAGIQNKVLEAMACGTPVIASPLAVSPLRAQPGVELEVAEGAQAFAEATLRLLEDPARRDAMARSGRAYVENYHSWDAVTAQLEETYREAALQA